MSCHGGIRAGGEFSLYANTTLTPCEHLFDTPESFREVSIRRLCSSLKKLNPPSADGDHVVLAAHEQLLGVVLGLGALLLTRIRIVTQVDPRVVHRLRLAVLENNFGQTF